jgi:putative methionine-R-sulfoxide reductase with GAF domain
MKNLINKIVLFLIVWLASKINFARAQREAHWDDAQNYAERVTKGNTNRLAVMDGVFRTLAHRMSERVTDIEDEKNLAGFYLRRDNRQVSR